MSLSLNLLLYSQEFKVLKVLFVFDKAIWNRVGDYGVQHKIALKDVGIH
jgi:hypothetical protein